MNAKERHELLKKQEAERIADLYEGCEEEGIHKRHMDAFYWRLTTTPLKHTKNVIGLGEGSELLEHLLRIMLRKRPNDEKADEWREALSLLQSYKNAR